MEIRVLKYFLTVVREESISRAAEVLHITQPTLSRQLAQMEEETGVKLFQRGSRKITLTNEGMLLRRRAEEIVELVDRTVAELPLQEKEVEGTITIGSGEVAGVEVLAEICGSFREKHPKVIFDLYTATADVVKERMERGLIDIGLLLEPVDKEKFAYARLAVKERFVVLMKPDDPLAEKECVTKDDLDGQPLILPRRLNVQGELANWFGKNPNSLNIAFTGNLPTNSAIMVKHGFGYAVSVEGAIPYWDKEQIVCRPLYPELTSGTVLAWKRGQPFGNATEKFIEHIKCFLGIGES
ncbi:MAG: LysR family transcriptional regulator [Succiniclasticum sp.]|jgi:DNA-binding transcriptional LysR family regulator|uniref:LysR family transcriptional regulator n=1 Tax=Succiniclasticum sp. TaxID=2775030 RepID=UPI002A91DF3D|nr:LysR family transcriptional regulator [Succiniclasticum sp.]MDY6290017.1 LysR family transcriptional regulator [Succiniclasticum sp.]